MIDRGGFSRRALVERGARAVAALVGMGWLNAPGALQALAARAPGGDDDDPPEAVKRVLAARFGDRTLRKGRVQLDVPENAPDGRAVPVFLETDLPVTATEWVKAFHLLVDFNPDIYVAGFTLSPAMGIASIDTRIKMRRTSFVRAIAETNRGELYYAATKVFVTLNGCG